MPSVSNISSPPANAARQGWAFAIKLEEVVLAKVLEANGTDKVKAQVFRITANRFFWPHGICDIPRRSILRALPRDLEPSCQQIFETRSNGRVSLPGPVSLSHAAWKVYTDTRNAYHARIPDRSLAVRKRERQAQRIKESRAFKSK